mmetsp:Transcript_98911/g.317127  ORF Transcript_98911/g.317127 Transcript_98911/m.317127 type:complete len:216 (+) Transcript_98911:1523-2170(+)
MGRLCNGLGVKPRSPSVHPDIDLSSVPDIAGARHRLRADKQETCIHQGGLHEVHLGKPDRVGVHGPIVNALPSLPAVRRVHRNIHAGCVEDRLLTAIGAHALIQVDELRRESRADRELKKSQPLCAQAARAASCVERHLGGPPLDHRADERVHQLRGHGQDVGAQGVPLGEAVAADVAAMREGLLPAEQRAGQREMIRRGLAHQEAALRLRCSLI